MKTKKGMLLASETLKIVIAVICIGFLVYFLVHLYFNNVNGRKLIEATNSLEKITGVISMVDQDGIEREDHLTNPSKWRLMSFVGSETKPNACAGINCLCICKDVKIDNFLFARDRQAKACDDKGVCTIVENLNEFGEIKIEADGTFVKINKVNGLIEISK